MGILVNVDGNKNAVSHAMVNSIIKSNLEGDDKVMEFLSAQVAKEEGNVSTLGQDHGLQISLENFLPMP